MNNGYTKTSTSTSNLPSVCTGADRWGVLFYISENATNRTGTQMYYPIDGTYKGRVFTRSILQGSATSDWFLLSTFDGDYDSLTNKPTIPTNVSQLNNDSNFLTSIPNEYITETELNSKGYLTEHQDLSDYALKSQIPTNYLTSIPSEYITETELNAKNYLTSIPSEYITETELNNKGYLTEHQSLSDYAKKSDIPSVPTKTSQLTNDSNFLTSVPSEYITESELNAKGYATTSQIPTVPSSLPANGGNADTVDNFHIVKLTQSQYNALSTKDSNTLYLIVG